MARWAETAVQRAIGQLLEVYEQQGKLLWWPVPNGSFIAGRDASERARRVAKMKSDRMLRPGVWDICILLRHGQLCIIEVKAGANGLTPEQRAFRDRAHEFGAGWAICRSVDEAKTEVDAWVARYDRQPLARSA